MHTRPRYPSMLLALLVAAAIGCGDDGTSPEQTSIEAFITRVALQGGATATLRAGDPPGPGSGPSINALTSATAVVGGSLGLVIGAASSFQRVILAVEGESGFFDISLPSGATSAILLITLNQNVDDNSFTVVIGAANAAGSFGGFAETDVVPIEVGTGEVQVSISWDAASDVDLHVVDPTGEEIYYGDPFSTSGGELDLDSNPACAIDGVNNENITWAANSPAGEYIVRVDYFDSCDVAATNYVVTVQVEGRQPQVFTGQLTGTGTHGGLGSGIEVTRFTK